VPDLLESGDLTPRESIATIASAMDVGNPSNLERLRQMHPAIDALRGAVRAVSVDDDAIRARIVADHARFGQIWCPHTAVAAEAWARLSAADRRDDAWCLVATASPAKFPEVVEPLLGVKVPVPRALAELLGRPTSVARLAATFPALRDAIEAGA
jgi:threonine synthase